MSADEYDAYLLWKLSAQQQIDYFRKDVKNLKDENEKLREDLEDQEGYDQMLRDRLRQQTELHVKAETENAKLRELVCWMYDCMDVSCAVQYPYSPAPISYNQLMKARARAHELGIEVDE